jgi:hypothetical protein
MTGGGNVAVGADIVRAVLSIVTSTTAPKTLGEGRSGEASDWNMYKTSWSRQNGTVVSYPYHERLVKFYHVFIKA